MTTAMFKSILSEYGYSTDKWIEVPEFLKIVLSDDSFIYLFSGSSTKYEIKLDTTNDLLLQRKILYKSNGDIELVRCGGIFDIAKIACVETNNPYSHSQFMGEFKGD